MNMTKIAVTGGSGKAGRAVVHDLLSRGHEVLNIDTALAGDSYRDTPAPYLPVDVTDYGQMFEALAGGEGMPKIEAVVHFAAIPSPAHHVPDQVFRTNMTSTYTVFSAAARLGLKRIVWASSETTLGLPFDQPPDYAPVDEEHIRPESSYALSKVLGEEMARQFHRWSGVPIIGLRFSNVMVRSDYEQFPSWQDDPHKRKWNLWGYVDESHVAQSVRARARRRHPGRRQLHHRRRRYGHASAQPRTDGRGVPRRRAARRGVGQRHPARHRQGSAGARLQPGVQLARPVLGLAPPDGRILGGEALGRARLGLGRLDLAVLGRRVGLQA